MKNMLGVALCDASGPLKDLNEKMSGKDGYEVLEKLKAFLRGDPVNTEGMICIPLEWSSDFGEAPDMNFVDGVANSMNALSCVKNNWRLPTEGELARALKGGKVKGFTYDMYYWTSTIDHHRNGFNLLMAYSFDTTKLCGCVGYNGSYSVLGVLGKNRKYPLLRLVREIPTSDSPV